MTTSKAMRELLERKGVAVTGDAKKDMAAAKKLKPDYKEYLRGFNNGL